MNRKQLKAIVVISLFGLIVGCSSAPVKETNYYLLNNYSSNNYSLDNPLEQNKTLLNEKSVDNNQSIYVLELAELSEYLNQPYLVMQLAEHQLHYARFHMWAESLHIGIGKALINDLNKQNQHSKH